MGLFDTEITSFASKNRGEEALLYRIASPGDAQQPQKATNQSYLDQNKSNRLKNGVLSSADLRVFLMAEVYDYSDANKDNPRYYNIQIDKDTTKKKLILIELDSVMSLSYSTIREVFPVRSLGRSNPNGHTRGARTISGHIAFAILNSDVLSYMREQLNNIYKDNKDNLDYAKTFGINSNIRLLDDLPPFHLYVLGQPEHEKTRRRLIIKHVRIIDENQYQGTSQPNIINKVTFVARDIVPLSEFGDNNTTGSAIDPIEKLHIYGGKLPETKASDTKYEDIGPPISASNNYIDYNKRTMMGNNGLRINPEYTIPILDYSYKNPFTERQTPNPDTERIAPDFQTA